MLVGNTLKILPRVGGGNNTKQKKKKKKIRIITIIIITCVWSSKKCIYRKNAARRANPVRRKNRFRRCTGGRCSRTRTIIIIKRVALGSVPEPRAMAIVHGNIIFSYDRERFFFFLNYLLSTLFLAPPPVPRTPGQRVQLQRVIGFVAIPVSEH